MELKDCVIRDDGFHESGPASPPPASSSRPRPSTGFGTAVAASSVNPASRASVPAGSGARLDAMLTMPHSRPSTLAGTPTAVRTPSSSRAGSATGG